MTKEYPTLLQKSLPIILAKIEKLHDKREGIINSAVASCDHPLEAIRELPYNANPFFTAKPWLVCTKCGYAEQGWYCGYKRLKHAEYKNPPKITHEQFCTYALVRKHQPIED
jgi:hypothetical protein